MQSRDRVRAEDQRSPRLLLEVEVLDEVAEDRRAFTYVGPRIGTPVRLRIEPPPAEEVVLDELRIRVEAQRLMVDEPTPRVRADHEARNTKAVAVLVEARRNDVV